MKEIRLSAVRTELRDYVEEVFASLPRKEQRAKGNFYRLGLMLDNQRKSMQPMSARLYSFEGTREVNAIIVGHSIIGQQALVLRLEAPSVTN